MAVKLLSIAFRRYFRRARSAKSYPVGKGEGMVPRRRVELPRAEAHTDLNRARLPIPPPWRAEVRLYFLAVWIVKIKFVSWKAYGAESFDLSPYKRFGQDGSVTAVIHDP